MCVTGRDTDRNADRWGCLMRIVIPEQCLRTILTVHWDNCRQPGCLILRMLEAVVAELEVPTMGTFAKRVMHTALERLPPHTSREVAPRDRVS